MTTSTISEQRKTKRPYRSAVRRAVHRLAKRRDQQFHQTQNRYAIMWCVKATQAGASDIALAIIASGLFGVGKEFLVAGVHLRKFMKTNIKVIAGLEKLRLNGLLSWRQNGDSFTVVVHLHL
jgi:hypothetical protein